MVDISEKAVEEFKKILNESGKDNLSVKFISSGSSCCGSSIRVLFVDKGEDEDIMIEKGGLKFYFEKEIGEDLGEFIIDYENGFIISPKIN